MITESGTGPDLAAIVGEVRTLFVWRSQNSKTGECSATYRTQASCPVACALRTVGPDLAAATGERERKGGCYAQHGRPGASPFGHAARGIAGASGIPENAAEVLPHGWLMRFNVSGDFLGADGAPDLGYIAAADRLAGARVAGCAGCEAAPDRPHLTSIAYTHAWRALGPRSRHFAHLAPRASVDTLAEVAEAAALGYAIATVAPQGDPAGIIGTAVAGVRLAPCPAQLPSALTCTECRACARPAGPAIVFLAHGAGRRRVAEVAR